VLPVKYEQGFYIPEDDILHSHSRENLKSYIALTGWTQLRSRNVSPVKYELDFCIPEDDILHLHFPSDDLPYLRLKLSFPGCEPLPSAPRLGWLGSSRRAVLSGVELGIPKLV
jgi:hypothetical protein